MQLTEKAEAALKAVGDHLDMLKKRGLLSSWRIEPTEDSWRFGVILCAPDLVPDDVPWHRKPLTPTHHIWVDARKPIKEVVAGVARKFWQSA